MHAAPPVLRAAEPVVKENEAAAPLSAAEFAALMASFGPFESRPRLAVAVSGGPDSLALCLLAHDWAVARDGMVVGLTVDHGLRAEAAAEATRVAGWLAARGIAHHILPWRPPANLRNVQAAARAARYDLLFAWCKEAGCLHLLTAHHREDQAETLLLRLARGSGLDGLAGMAASREVMACRLLRPLLAVPRARLAASLRAADRGWIEDPSNRDPAYARSRLRASAAVLAREGLSAARLATTAGHLGRARAALEDGVTRLLAGAAWLHPAGFAAVDPASLAEASPELALRALARLVATVGGADHMPRLERILRLYDAVRAGLPAPRTLGGCRFMRRRGLVVVCREPAAVEPPRPVLLGATFRWDDRFVVTVARRAPGGLTVGALGAAGFGKRATPTDRQPIPPAARATLPALRDLVGIVAVPHLDYVREDLGQIAVRDIVSVAFRPKWPLAAPGFTVV
jgi:tRNA(Ile)-lysidine synthase